MTFMLDRLPGGLNIRRRAPGLYQKLLKGLYGPVPNKPMYHGSQIDLSASGSLDHPSNGKHAHLSLSVLPKRQRKKFLLPGKTQSFSF
jgi:hypothetical protein